MDVKEFKKITKKKFDNAYNTHLSGKWIRLAYKYFSKETEKKDFAPKRIIFGVLMGLFAIGMAGTIFKWSLVGPVTIVYAILLGILVFCLFSAVLANNCRIRRIRKILDVNKYQYNYLVDKFYPQK